MKLFSTKSDFRRAQEVGHLDKYQNGDIENEEPEEEMSDKEILDEKIWADCSLEPSCRCDNCESQGGVL